MRELLDLPARIRLGFAALALLLALADDRVLALAPWILLVVVLDLGAALVLTRTVSRAGASNAVGLMVSTAVVAGAAYAVAGLPALPGTPARVALPALPLLWIPAYHAGLVLGRRSVPLVCGTAAIVELVVVLAREGLDRVGKSGELVWLLTGVIMALLGAWSLQLSRADAQVEAASAREASALLRRLQELADSMNTGFDAPALGEVALTQVGDALASDRSALLVAQDGWPVPVALRGSTRFPWLAPSEPGSALRQTWESGVGQTTSFRDGELTRHVLTVPMVGSNGDLLGMLVADRGLSAYGLRDLDAATHVAETVAPALEASLLFTQLREGAAVEERARLAREMHDGLAQDMAALAYQADAVRHLVAAKDQGAATAMDDLRDAIRGAVVDMRTHIADLRMLDRPDRSLGAILGTSLQSLANTTGIRTTLALSESRLRFPADVELNLHRLATDVLNDARNGDGVTMFEMDVDLHPPYADLRLHHDGSTRLSQVSFEEHALVRSGALVEFEAEDRRNPMVRIRLGDETSVGAGLAQAGAR